MNKAMLVGRLGKDPETVDVQRKNKDDTTITKFSLATQKGKDAETQWHNIVAWGKTGTVLQEYVKKGDQLAIEGEIRNGSHEKDGRKVYTSEINLDTFTFIGGKSNNNDSDTEDEPPF